VIYEMLSDQGLIDFSEATPVIREVFVGEKTFLRPDSEAARAVTDLMHLNAAEAHLVGQVLPLSEPLEPPVRVSPESARFATWTTDSGPFLGHDPRKEPALWDVTLFGGDASKLAWLSGSWSVEALRDKFDAVISDLAGLYEGREDPIGFGRRDVFDLRATLWRAKIAVLLGEDAFPVRTVSLAQLTR
jgi:hypothetical protein